MQHNELDANTNQEDEERGYALQQKPQHGANESSVYCKLYMYFFFKKKMVFNFNFELYWRALKRMFVGSIFNVRLDALIRSKYVVDLGWK